MLSPKTPEAGDGEKKKKKKKKMKEHKSDVDQDDVSQFANVLKFWVEL